MGVCILSMRAMLSGIYVQAEDVNEDRNLLRGLEIEDRQMKVQQTEMMLEPSGEKGFGVPRG